MHRIAECCCACHAHTRCRNAPLTGSGCCAVPLLMLPLLAHAPADRLTGCPSRQGRGRWMAAGRAGPRNAASRWWRHTTDRRYCFHRGRCHQARQPGRRQGFGPGHLAAWMQRLSGIEPTPGGGAAWCRQGSLSAKSQEGGVRRFAVYSASSSEISAMRVEKGCGWLYTHEPPRLNRRTGRCRAPACRPGAGRCCEPKHVSVSLALRRIWTRGRRRPCRLCVVHCSGHSRTRLSNREARVKGAPPGISGQAQVQLRSDFCAEHLACCASSMSSIMLHACGSAQPTCICSVAAARHALLKHAGANKGRNVFGSGSRV